MPNTPDEHEPSISVPLPTSTPVRVNLQLTLPNVESLIAGLLLFIAVAFNLYQLYPEVALQVPTLNDGVLHMLNLRRTVDALAAGQDPTDTWLAQIALGYPLFHYYQHLPYLPPAALYQLLGGALPLDDLFRWTGYALLSLFPLSIYGSMRRFGFARLPSALAGLLASLIATNGLYGFEYGSYVWRGFGLYTQLWGMLLLPMALGQCYVTLREGRGYFWSVLLLAATIMSHVVLGYVALGSVVMMAVLLTWAPGKEPGGRRVWRSARRLVLVLVLVGLATSYFVIPFVRDSAYLNRSVWEDAGKYDSYGYPWVLGTLVKGGLFDFGRLPVLTLLAGLGLAICLWRWREERYRIPVALTLVWLLLYFGRPTWSVLLNLLPMSGDLQFHRLIAGVHLGGIYLMGIGLALPWSWALSRLKARYLLIPASLTALVLFPVYRERGAYLAQNAQWQAESRVAFAVEDQDLDALFKTLQQLPPGRVYAGLPAKWGKDYKVGAVPMYALLNGVGLDMLGYLYHALSFNGDVQVLFDDGRVEQYNLFNVRYVVVPVDWTVPQFYKPLGDFGRHRLYRVETTGYLDLVGSDQPFAGSKSDVFPAASSWLVSDLVGAKQHPTVFLGSTGDAQLYPLSQATQIISHIRAAPATDRGRILSEAVESNAYQAEVQVTRESLLMLKVTYHPNWHAYVDGAQVSTVMLMPSYVGVKITPGTHSVRFEYQPGPLRGLLMILGLLTLAMIAVVEWRREAVGRLVERLGVGRVARQVAAWVLGARQRLTVRAEQPGAVGFRTKLGIYLLFLSIYLMSGAGHFFSTDHVAVYLTTQGIIERGSLAIKPINDAAKGRDGNYYAVFGLGQSIADIPLYLVGKFVDGISPPAVKAYFGGVQLGDWGGTVPIFFVSLLNQFVTPLTCVLILLFCVRLGFSLRTSFLTTLIFGLSTAAWVYARDSFQHPLESLLLLLSIYILFANQGNLRPRHMLLSGAALGMGILTRINLLAVLPAIAIYLLYIASNRIRDRTTVQEAGGGWANEAQPPRARLQQVWSRVTRQEVLKALALFVSPVLLALAVSMYLNYMQFGQWLALRAPGRVAGFSTPIWLGLYGNLLSVGRSVWLYSPPTFVVLFAFGRFYRKHRAEAILFASIIAIYLAVYSTYGFWDGGWCWGPRFLVATIPFMILPLGYFLGGRARTLVLAVAVCLGVGVQILGVAINYSYVYWDWIGMKLSPPQAFLFVPDISPIPTYLQALAAGRHIDLWLLEVYKQFGIGSFLATLAVPLLMMVGSLAFLGLRLRPGRVESVRTEDATARR